VCERERERERRGLYLPTFSHVLIVNKLFSLSLSLPFLEFGDLRERHGVARHTFVVRYHDSYLPTQGWYSVWTVCDVVSPGAHTKTGIRVSGSSSSLAELLAILGGHHDFLVA